MFGGLKKAAKKISKMPKKAVGLVTNPVKTVKSIKSLPKRVYQHGIYDAGKNLQRGSTKIAKALPIAAAVYAGGGSALSSVAAGAAGALGVGSKKGGSGTSSSSARTPAASAPVVVPKSRLDENLAAYKANRDARLSATKPTPGAKMANRATPSRLRKII